MFIWPSQFLTRKDDNNNMLYADYMLSIKKKVISLIGI